jgi:hypothetical protein
MAVTLRKGNYSAGHGDDRSGLVASALRIGLGVAIGGNQVDLAVERELAFLAKPR